MRYDGRQEEQGFVLATALVMLSLLTLMAVAMFFTGRTSVQVSSGAQNSTEGHYYAETAVNYIIWAMRNDAEFDNYSYGGSGPLYPNPASPANAANVGDWNELIDNFANPGPTTISDAAGPGTSGQLMYFDNTPLSERKSRGGIGAIVWPLPTSGPDIVYPSLYHISARLPRYIRLDIDSSGNVTPAIPPVPHPSSPVVGTDIPNNGAIVWLTTGNANTDFELDPTLANCSGTPPTGTVACGNADPAAPSWKWLSTLGTLAAGDLHGVVAYAIGYVGGRPNSIIRAQIK